VNKDLEEAALKLAIIRYLDEERVKKIIHEEFDKQRREEFDNEMVYVERSERSGKKVVPVDRALKYFTLTDLYELGAIKIDRRIFEEAVKQEMPGVKKEDYLEDTKPYPILKAKLKEKAMKKLDKFLSEL
jgi:hypothetical protein